MFDLQSLELAGSRMVQPASQLPEVDNYEEFRELARETILKQTRLAYDTNLPIAFHLSGGLDSNTLVGLCRYLHPEQQVRCVTSLVDGERDPEWEFIRESADHHHARLEAVDVTSDSFFDILEEVIYQLDEPVGDPGVVAQFLVNRQASSESRIVYSGQGFDEMFSGYMRDLGCGLLATYGPDALSPASELDRPVPEDARESFYGWEGFMEGLARPQQVEPELALFKKLCRFNPFEPASGLSEEFSDMLQNVALDAYVQLKTSSSSVYEFMVNVETEIQLPSLLHMEDRASMNYSLETRVPFCTASVLDLARRSRMEWTLRGAMPKGLLRDIFQDVIPPAILARRQKVGRPIPFRAWLKSERGRGYLEELNRNRGLFQELTHTDLVGHALHHPNAHDRTAWALLCLSRWLQLYKVVV